MSETVHCPDCGHENPPGLDACAACGFPLADEPPTAAAPPKLGEGAGGTAERVPIVRRPPRRRPPRPETQSVTLWLVFGTLAALVVVWIAIKANVDRASQPVEGSSGAQQMSADSILGEIQRDSTNVQARVKLGDILYDTGNWADAIVQYRAAVRMDSSLTPTIVDLGVCYYNLGDPDDAERHFLLALARDPHQPVALFNLGIVHERRKDYRGALEYLHRALRTEPPEQMKQAVVEAMGRIQQQQGLQPKPLQEP